MATTTMTAALASSKDGNATLLLVWGSNNYVGFLYSC
jgi:hypothetical protein